MPANEIQYHVVMCECPSSKEEVEGLLPTVSHAFECPSCKETIRTLDCRTYETMYFRSITKKLKPVKIKGPTIKLWCRWCEHVFQATNVHDNETRICPKCGKAIKIKHVGGICEGCHTYIERYVQEGIHVIKCNVCGNNQPVL